MKIPPHQTQAPTKKNIKKSNNKRLYYKAFKYKYYKLNIKNKPEVIKKKLPQIN